MKPSPSVPARFVARIPDPSCWVQYLPAAVLENYIKAGGHEVLGLVRYGGPALTMRGLDPLQIVVPLNQLGGEEEVEVWLSSEPVVSGSADDVSFAMNRNVALLCVRLPEDDGVPVEALTERAYDAILNCASSAGYTHLVRIWNHFSAITGEQQGVERYQRFSIGRQAAFDRHGITEPSSMPAASAMGTRGHDFLVYALASRRPATAIENPRQVSAYHYPRRYGPTSPAFSRAMLTNWGSESHLYVSGTASIVGHESQHDGEWAAQAEEVRRNLEVLLQHASACQTIRMSRLLAGSTVKIYARQMEPAVAALGRSLAEVWGQRLPSLFIEADLCRADLLIEVEAVLRFAA